MAIVQPETALQNQIRLELSNQCADLKHFRNHTGSLPDRRGGMVRFGLGAGSPDIIGWRSVLVTPDMVGHRLAIFTGIEVKMPGERPRADQRQWLGTLKLAGGIAGVATTPAEAVALVNSVTC